MKLRPYQQAFADAIIRSLWENRSLIAVAPTGSGKTVIIASIVNRFITKFPEKSVIICVHRIELVSQTIEKLNAVGIKAFPIIAGNKNIPYSMVYVAMLETLYNRLEKVSFNPGLVIYDEAHIGSHFKVIRKLSDSLVLGLSATPVSSKKDPLKNYFKDIVIGPTVKSLIDERFLCKPITFTKKGNVDRGTLSIKAGEFSESSQFLQLSKPKQLHNTLAAYNQLALGKKTLIFNANIDHNNTVTELFQNAGHPARSVDGNSTDRIEIFKWFKETPGAILCNVGIATTGFDEPSVKSVILNFCTKSLAKYLQCIGRGSRPHSGKSDFTIIDLGDNYLDFGLWESEQDWYVMFHFPSKPSSGAPPLKSCPECECLVQSNCYARYY